MKIKINKIVIINFKGCQNRTINFNKEETTILGANRSGKSTIFDAFLWCLFGKNAQGETDFSIKNTVITSLNKEEHSVEVELSVGAEIVTFKRVLKEIWREVRGEGELEFKGHENKFFWNLIPIGTLKEYTAKVEQIIDLDTFRLLTNPLYFNALPWEKRRSFITTLVDGKSFDTSQFNEVIALIQNKSIKELKAQLAATKKETKKVLDGIPARIDEVLKMKIEEKPEIGLEIASSENKIVELEKVIESEVNSKKNEQENAVKIANKKAEIDDKISEYREEYRTINNYIKESKNSDLQLATLTEERIEFQKNNIGLSKQKKELKNSQLSEIKEKWLQLNSSEFIGISENECICPTCKREFETGDIESKTIELKNNFNADKLKRLEILKLDGDELSKSIKFLENDIIERTNKLENLQKELIELTNKKYDDSKLKAILSKVEILQKELSEIKEPEPIKYSEIVDNAKAEIIVLKAKVLELQKIQTQIENNKNLDVRVKELQNEQRVLAQKIADNSKIERQIDLYETAEMNYLENEINNQFQDVSFSLFKKIISTGENELCCTTLVKGVPFSDANTEGKVNAGLEIIDVFSKKNNIYLPIFIDNRESVSRIHHTESQIINLVVDETKNILEIV